MNDNLKNNVKGAFDQVEDDFNPDFIWQGINDKMQPKEKKKKRFFVFWFWGIGAGLLLVSGSLFLYNSSDSTNDEIFTESSSSDKIGQVTMEGDVSYSKDVLHKSTTDLNELAISNQEDKSIAELTENIQSDNVGLQKSHVKIDNSQRVILNESSIQARNIEVNISNFSDVNKQEKQMPQQLIKSIPSIPTFNESKKVLSDKGSAKVNEKLDIVYLATSDINQFDRNEKDRLPILVVEQKKSNKNEVFGAVEMYSGISFGSKVSLSSNSEYAEIKNNTEELLEQLNVGIRAQVFKSNTLSFWAGISYSRITDSWKSKYNYTEDLPYTYTDYVTEFSDGSTESHMTTETVAYDVARNVVQFNSEQIISIPLEARYQLQYNRWKMAASLGFDFNYILGAEHTIIGIDGFPAFERKVGQWMSPSVSSRLSAGYAISPLWNIYAGLNYRVLNIRNSTLVPDLQSKYTLVGFELGIGRCF